jgi:hypothetical protein
VVNEVEFGKEVVCDFHFAVDFPSLRGHQSRVLVEQCRKPVHVAKRRTVGLFQANKFLPVLRRCKNKMKWQKVKAWTAKTKGRMKKKRGQKEDESKPDSYQRQ